MINNLKELAKLIRYYILLMTTTAGSGHTTSSLSAVELMTTLMFSGTFRADLDNPQYPNNDRLIFSKGHASPLFYAIYAAAGKLTQKDLLEYRKFTSNLEGHPTLAFPYTEAPTGSLGQGLSIGVGMAVYAKRIAKLPYRTFVLMGDGEMAEGSVWEALTTAANYKLDNLTLFLDINRLGQSQETMYGHHLDIYRNKIESFGWDTAVIDDGHDIKAILGSLKKLGVLKDKPLAILAKTYKGFGVEVLSDKDNWHGKPLPKDLYEQAVKGLGEIDHSLKGKVGVPQKVKNIRPVKSSQIKQTNYKIGDLVATRQAIGDAISDLMYENKDILVLDGDVQNSLYTERAQKEHGDRYLELYIAEQNMTGMAIGLWRRGAIPFMTTFAAFMSRSYDQIRMSGLAGANIKFFGSHAGVSIGEDGASQMGLEDISMFRSVYNSTVLNPADAVSSRQLTKEMVRHKGIAYIRGARPATPVIYGDNEEFPIGGSKIHRVTSSTMKQWNNVTMKSKVIIISAGVTLYEALKAQNDLLSEGIEAIVVDCYSIKPIDTVTLKNLTKESDKFIVVEDHWFDGGLGDAVLNVFSHNSQPITHNPNIYKLAVSKLPHSAKPAELLAYMGIDSKAIVEKAKEMIS